MLRLPAGVSFKSHVRDVAPRLMSVFNFTTFDFGQVSTFDWIIHLEPALKLFVLLLKQCRVELLQLRLWRLSQLGRRRRNGRGPRSHYLLLFPRNTRCTDWTHSPHSAVSKHTYTYWTHMIHTMQHKNTQIKHIWRTTDAEAHSKDRRGDKASEYTLQRWDRTRPTLRQCQKMGRGYVGTRDGAECRC